MTIETRPAVAPATQPKTTADVLRHAALIMEERGWYQGYYSEGLDHGLDDTGPVCALGAIGVAWSGNANGADRLPFDHPVMAAAYRVMDGDTPHWNDAPGRTAAEVVAALRAAADEADR